MDRENAELIHTGRLKRFRHGHKLRQKIRIPSKYTSRQSTSPASFDPGAKTSRQGIRRLGDRKRDQSTDRKLWASNITFSIMINDIRKKLYDLIVARQAVALSRFHDIRAVTIGDPYTFANSELPAIAIIGEDGQINARGTEYDTQTRTITIILVQSIKDTLGKNDNTRIEWDYRIAEMTE